MLLSSQEVSALKVWDNSPWQMKQLDQIGTVAVRRLAATGITSIEALEFTEAHQIDMTLSRNPPFGSKLLARVAEFPKLRVSVKLTGRVYISNFLPIDVLHAMQC